MFKELKWIKTPWNTVVNFNDRTITNLHYAAMPSVLTGRFRSIFAGCRDSNQGSRQIKNINVDLLNDKKIKKNCIKSKLTTITTGNVS